MKKYTLLSCIFLSALCSCKKDPPSKSNIMEYTVSGPKDTTYAYHDLTLPLNIKYTSGDKSSVQLSLSGLPKGLNGRITDSSGTPDFNTHLSFSHDDYIAAGTYPVTINAKAGNTGSKSASFNMIVKGSCGDFMSGNYNTEITYTSSGALLNKTTYTVSVKADNPNRLYFYEGKNAEADFYGDVDCSTATFTIPPQSKPGSSLNYSGSGKLTTKTKSMEFTVVYTDLPELKFVMTRP